MMEHWSGCDHLFLLRDDTSIICVNNCQLLQQHQIDGLRFLFRQFHKKKPVAIANFPEQCGKSVTVALFINAVKSLLKKPVLIICNNEKQIESWKQIILKWTDYNIDDIAIEATNVYIRKKIFLKSYVELTSYQRPDWSVVVVKNEISKPIYKLTFTADLKIWLTSTNMKKDLNMLAYTYNWLLPLSKTKVTMNAQDFLPSGDTVREKVEKAILLDSFIEEFVIQRTKMTPFNNTQTSTKRTVELSRNNEKTPQKSRKNKDATGTKIKRSRRIIEDDENTTHENELDDHKKESNEDNMDSQNILLEYNNTVEHNNPFITENVCLAKDNVRIKNVLEKSTESIDFHEIETERNVSTVINKGIDCGDINENCKENIKMLNEIGQENITDCSTNYNGTKNNDIVNSGHKNAEMDTDDNEKYADKMTNEVLENVDNKEQGTDYKQVSDHDTDDIDEWQAKALKKFKGSLLDTMF